MDQNVKSPGNFPAPAPPGQPRTQPGGIESDIQSAAQRFWTHAITDINEDIGFKKVPPLHLIPSAPQPVVEVPPMWYRDP